MRAWGALLARVDRRASEHPPCQAQNLAFSSFPGLNSTARCSNRGGVSRSEHARFLRARTRSRNVRHALGSYPVFSVCTWSFWARPVTLVASSSTWRSHAATWSPPTSEPLGSSSATTPCRPAASCWSSARRSVREERGFEQQRRLGRGVQRGQSQCSACTAGGRLDREIGPSDAVVLAAHPVLGCARDQRSLANGRRLVVRPAWTAGA